MPNCNLRVAPILSSSSSNLEGQFRIFHHLHDPGSKAANSNQWQAPKNGLTGWLVDVD